MNSNNLILFGLIIGIIMAMGCIDNGEPPSDHDEFSIDQITYRINPELSVSPEEIVGEDNIIDVTEGDIFSLVTLKFNSPTSKEGAWAEAYFHDSTKPGEAGWEYDEGQFTFGNEIEKGENKLIFKPDNVWKLEQKYDRFVVVLIHQFGPRDHEYRQVDKVYINLRCLPKS